jgi:uncharacterized Rossmann fold enzyme
MIEDVWRDTPELYERVRDTEPKTCCICGARPALRKVAKKGYCRDHYANAVSAASGAPLVLKEEELL